MYGVDVHQNVTVKSLISPWLPHNSKSRLVMDPAYLRKLSLLMFASLSIHPLSSHRHRLLNLNVDT